LELVDDLKRTGFEGCGKTRSGLLEVSGHDFSRAVKAAELAGL
jgi:hypothetical protein